MTRLSPLIIRESRSLIALDLPDDLPFEEWLAIGRDLAKADRALCWLIGDWWHFGIHHYGGRKKLVATPHWKGPDFQSCADYGWVCGKFETSLRSEVLSFAHHREVAALESEAALDLLSRAERGGDNGKPWTVKQLREAVFRFKSDQNRKPVEDGCTIDDLHALIASGQRFSTIYCDPPWTFEVFGALGKDRSAEKHYDTLSLEEIEAWPVADLAADDCVLLMWAINPELPGALDVVRAWGFNYKTVGFTWVKQNPSGEGWFTGLGYWTRANTEPCLLATRGKPQRIERDVEQLIVAPVGRHSEKPAVVYERIERLVSGPYIELFARDRRPGWWAWGNEISRRQIAAE